MGTMCDIGWAWGNEGDTTADTVCEFVEFMVEKQYAQFGGQIVASSRMRVEIEDCTMSNAQDLRRFIEKIGLDELQLRFEYNARYTGARWPESRVDQLAKEVEDAASRAAYIENPDLASIDIYSGVRFGPTEQIQFDKEGLPFHVLSGWSFTVGGDGYVTDMENLEKHLLEFSPTMVEIRQGVERIFKVATFVVCEES